MAKNKNNANATANRNANRYKTEAADELAANNVKKAANAAATKETYK